MCIYIYAIMATKRSVEEVLKNDEEADKVIVMESKDQSHPYAFHVSGPRNVSSPNWKDLINSSWLVIHKIFNLSCLLCSSMCVL